MSNKIISEKNLLLSAATLSVSEIARSTSDMSLNINLPNLVRTLKAQGMFVKYPNDLLIIRVQKRERGYTVAVLPPRTSDLIKKHQNDGKISITEIENIARAKILHMNTKRLASAIKTVCQTAIQLKIEVIYTDTDTEEKNIL